MASDIRFDVSGSLDELFEQLIGDISAIFIYDNEWAGISDASSEEIDSLFSSALQLENKIKSIKQNSPQTIKSLNEKLQFFENKTFPKIMDFSDYEMACDRLLTVFIINKQYISDSALNKAVNYYLNNFTKDRFNQLYYKLIAQCLVACSVSEIVLDYDSNSAQDYDKVLSDELPKLINKGRSGFVAATKLIQNLMIENVTSLEALLNAWLMCKENTSVECFIRQTLLNTLKPVDDNYARFWKLIVKFSNINLISNVANKYPDFLFLLEMFIVCCGEAMTLTIRDFKLHWNCQYALISHSELQDLIRNIVSSGGYCGAYIEDIISKRQTRAMGDLESSHSNVWIELGKCV